MTRRNFLRQAACASAACAAGAFALSTHARAQTRPPNFLVLVTDDQRWDTLGCMGNRVIQTPNIDRIAARGTRFDNAFVTTAICCASRASLLTGLYTSTHGIEDFATALPEPLFNQTYPALLRQAGYRTGFIGKYGVGTEMPAAAFDYWRGFPGQGVYFHDVDGQRVHLTRIIENQSVEFLRECTPETPFCLSVSFKAPHVQDDDPRQFLYDPMYEELYADVQFPRWETEDPRYFDRMPEYLRNSEGRKRWDIRFSTEEKFQASMRGYYRLITGVDRAAGSMLAELEARGLADNTVIVFTSDNGFFLGEYGLAGKWLMHEPSIRVPFLVYDPRVSEGARAPVREEMVLNIDLSPTILDLAGLGVPEIVQGETLAPLLQRGQAPWRTEWFYEHHFGDGRPAPIPANEGIRTERWKYIRYLGREPLYEELYDLAADPGEMENLVGVPAHGETLAEMRRRWQVWRESLTKWDAPRAPGWKPPR